MSDVAHLTEKQRHEARRALIEKMISANAELFTPVVSDGELCTHCDENHGKFTGPGIVTEWLIAVALHDAGDPDPDPDNWIIPCWRHATRHHLFGLAQSIARRFA